MASSSSAAKVLGLGGPVFLLILPLEVVPLVGVDIGFFVILLGGVGVSSGRVLREVVEEARLLLSFPSFLLWVDFPFSFSSPPLPLLLLLPLLSFLLDPFEDKLDLELLGVNSTELENVLRI